MKIQRHILGWLLGLSLVLPSAQAQSSTPSPWPMPPTVGGGFGVQIKQGLVTPRDLARIHDLGFGFVRVGLGWADIERTPGAYVWSETDQLIEQIRAANLKIVLIVMGSHPAYEMSVPAPAGNVDHVERRIMAPRKPESFQAFARFAAQAAARYDGPDIVWEIWNEPDMARFWPPKADAEAYAVLASVTEVLMHQVAPNATLIGPALARVPDARDGVSPAYIDKVLSSPVAKRFGGISLHPYRHGYEVPEAAFGDYDTLYPLLMRHRIYAPLINSEWGYATNQVTLEQQQAYILRARLTDMLWGVPLSIWYEWQDSRKDLSSDGTDLEAHFGLLERDGQAKPVVAYLDEHLHALRNTVLDRQIATTNPRDVVVRLRYPDGKGILVGWTLRQADDRFVEVVWGDSRRARLTAQPEILGSHEAEESVRYEEQGP